MIEEIKKEIWKIREKTFTKKDKEGRMCNEWVDCLSFNDDILPLIKILDKYNNQMFGKHTLKDIIYKVEQHGYKVINNDEFSRFVQLLLKYKNAWEELKEPYKELLAKCNEYEEVEIISLMKSVLKGIVDKMEELEQKYNIGGEND